MTQPRRDDELKLFKTMRSDTVLHFGTERLSTIFDLLGIPEKRGAYILSKWSDKGWWDYGVSLYCGWFTDKAPDELLQ